jgi:hypothetical protein
MSTAGNYRTFVPSLKTWSGSVAVVWDEQDSGQDLAVLGTEVSIHFYPDTDGSGHDYYEGSAIITATSQSASYDGLVERTINFSGTGELTHGVVGD